MTAWEVFNEGKGVCRDYAHLAITFCRCMNIPARYCTGYLGDIGVPPPYGPMDFAGWFEAYLGGRWYTFDPRNNMPRIGRVLIAQGRDAADVPITHTFGPNTLVSFKVWTDEVARAATRRRGAQSIVFKSRTGPGVGKGGRGAELRSGKHGIERAQMRKEIGRRLGELSRFAEIQRRRRALEASGAHRSEEQRRLAGLDLERLEPDPGARRVVRAEKAGRERARIALLGVLARRIGDLTGHLLDGLAGETAGAQKKRTPAETGDDRRFKADRGRATIDHRVDAPVEVGQHMGGSRRADMAGAIGRRRDDRPLRHFQQ